MSPQEIIGRHGIDSASTRGIMPQLAGPYPRSLRILVLESDSGVRGLLTEVLSQGVHQVLAVTTSREALRCCAEEAIDLVLMAGEVPNMSAPTLALCIRSLSPHTSIFVVTGSQDAQLPCGGAVRKLFAKPFDISELRAAVDEVAALQRFPSKK